MAIFKKNWYILFLVAISILPLFDLFHSGLPVTHDGQDHVARIANFYQNLKEGNIIPRWAGNLNWGYGHPILMFLYPLPSYSASFFHFLGFSLVDSLKILFGLSFILSGLAMFLWVKEFLGTQEGIVAAFLYTFAPYRFIDFYVRGAIGEHVAFIFPPLILYFILKLSKKIQKKHLIGCTLSLSGLILSHNAMSLMFIPIVFLYSLFFLVHSEFKMKFFLCCVFVFLIGFALSSFFWMPAFLEGKYTLRDKVTAGGYMTSFVPFSSFIYSIWNYGGTGQFSVQVGIVHWIFLFTGLFLSYYRKNKKIILLSSAIFLLFWLTIFLMIPLSNPVWNTITTLQKFQFPWRFLSVIVFLTSVMGAFTIFFFPRKIKLILVVITVVLLIIFNKDYWHAKGYLEKPENFYTGVYFGTTDTGESAPIWSIRFMEKTPKDRIEVISGEASIKTLVRKTNRHSYQINTSGVSRIRENTLFFPGWKVYIDGKQTDIQFQDPMNRGLMTFFVEKGLHNVDVVFRETKLRLISNLISVFSFIMVMSFYFIPTKLWKRFL